MLSGFGAQVGLAVQFRSVDQWPLTAHIKSYLYFPLRRVRTVNILRLCQSRLNRLPVSQS